MKEKKVHPVGFSVKMGLQQLVFPESPQAEFPFFLVHPGFAYLGGVDVRFRNKGVFRLGSFCWHTRDNADRGDLARAAAGICWKTSRALLASNPIERRGGPRFYRDSRPFPLIPLPFVLKTHVSFWSAYPTRYAVSG